ncbi:MAG TPA: protein tyrosine phosphatase family protein [Stellaceae bacterium]|nr:protein tyrosine phosphatase family protein [Stellaceae bacterium]
MARSKLEALTRLSGKAAAKALGALERGGLDIRAKLAAPIGRVPGRAPPSQPKPAADPTDPETIYNWRRLDERVTTSGQPTEPQLAGLHDLGIRHVVNLGLHSHEKALPDEAASLSRLGMTYIHIPVDFKNPTEQDFARFCTAMDELKDAPVHVHCIANYRVSAFFYRYRRDILGADEAAARAEMEEVWKPDRVWQAFIANGPRASRPQS